MRSRLLTSTVAVALVAVVVLGLPLAYVVSRFTRLQVTDSLDGQARLIGNEVLRQQRAGDDFSDSDLAAIVQTITGSDFVDPAQRVEFVDRQGRRFSSGPVLAEPLVSSRRLLRGGGNVVVSVPIATVQDRQERAVLPITLLGLAAVAVAVGLALVVARRLTVPFATLARVSDELGAGNFTARAPPSGILEADQVATALNRSALRIQELVQREREFSSNTSHQLRTPLAALSLRLEKLLLAYELSPDAREEVHTALGQVDRLSGTVAELLDLARSGRAGDAEPTDVRAVVSEHAREWQDYFSRVGRELTVTTNGQAMALATTGALQQALDVLLDNALRHGGGRTRVTVGSRRQEGAAGTAEAQGARPGQLAGFILVSVSDEGPGVPSDLVPRIFQRHASDGTGSGIGLALARNLVESGGGRLELATVKPAQFDLYLPQAPPTAATS